ncbi:hypothetical protein NR798_36980 [Archangium gephyra]|uniref:hypothetical protein n=1 Tax=Archangium gephyra TaxID=48 RepID=UPI0035D44448
MPDAFRHKVITTLIEEIALLTGGRFEQFGYVMMRVIHPAHWVERGTTVDGAPRGYTVDTSAMGAALVAEMSSDSHYFHGSMSKPRSDLLHAIDLHPDVKHLWLLSSREATAGETTEIANLVAEFTTGRYSSMQVDILDSRAIAGHIFENLESERFVRDLTAYLPSVGRLADEHAFSHHVPVYGGYLPRPAAERAVTDRLAAASSAVIKGISGIGKSALAARVAETLRSQFELVIWLDARELHDVKRLTDVDVLRTGTHHNVTSLLRRHKCLLVLDDATLPPDQIASMDCGSSKLIVTCQTTSAPLAITVGDLDRGSAQALLEAGVPERCPQAVLQRVLSSVGGHPLLLSALNRVAQDDGWEGVNACCSDAVRSIEDERHDKVCQRILLRHRAPLADELEFVKWCDEARFDAELAAVCVSGLAVRNLQKRAFLAATTSGDVRVHDVVYKSIRAVISVSRERESLFREKLDEFIRTEHERGDLLVRRVTRVHANLLLRLLRSDRRPSFVYAAALARVSNTPLEVFADPVATARALAASNHWLGREIEIRAVIESVEALYTLTSASRGADSARTSLQTNITALEILCGSLAASGELLRDLKHHHAKMLERLAKYEQAEAEFREILLDHPTFAAARLQLARILEKTRRSRESLEQCREILARYEADENSVSSAVLLETLRLLASQGSPGELAAQEPVIMRSLARARDLDRGHAFQLIASVAQKTHYTMPELTLRLFDAIEWRDSVPASDSERFNWAQAHKAAAKATEASDPRRREFLLAADEVYAGIASSNSYQKIQHAEALILLDRFADADSRLEQVPERDRNWFWWQRKAQALQGMMQSAQALNAINRALDGLQDKKFMPAFLRDRFVIRKALSDPDAEEDLRQAISELPLDNKYRRELEAELARLVQENQAG